MCNQSVLLNLVISVINGEKAAVNNPLFTQKRERTLEMLIRNMYQEYMADINKVSDVCFFKNDIYKVCHH